MGTVNTLVKDYVEQRDAEAVRTALTTIGYIADLDSFQSFKSSTEYAGEKLGDLFQQDDEQPYDTSASVDSYKRIIKMMMSNFSREKYSSAVKIGTSVFPEKPKKAADTSEKLKNEVPVSDGFFTKLLRQPMRLVAAAIILIAVIVAFINLLK